MEKLGEGFEGEVFKTKDGKIYKIARSNNSIQQLDLTHPFWREIAFADFAKRYPQYFMQLEKYGVDLKCTHKRNQPKWLKDIPKEEKKWQKYQKEPYCINMTYTPLLDGTLGSLYIIRDNQYLQKLNRETWEFPAAYYKFCYGLLLQQYYILYILDSAAWIHEDAHTANWMYKKSTQVQLTGLPGISFKYKFPYQLMLCDYGQIYHKSFPTGTNDHKDFSYDRWRYMDFILNSFYFYQPSIFKLLGHDKYVKFEDRVIKAAKKEVTFRKTNSRWDNDAYMWLYAIKFPNKFAALSENEKVIKSMIQYPTWEVEFVEFILNNYHHPKKVLKKISELYNRFA